MGFLDESGISLRPIIGRTWSPKGQTPIIKASAVRWERRSVIGLIVSTPSGRKPRLYLRIFKGTINSKEIIRFFKELRRHLKGRKLLLVWDRLPSHRSKEMKEFMETQKWLKIEFLPPYAPELNPLEYLWSSGKRKDLANLYAENLIDIDKAIYRYKSRLRRQPHLLTGFLKASTLFD